jgi:hypothetical protein
MDLLITTHEIMRIERSTPTTSDPVKIRFPFHIGYDVFLSVKAEVTEETDADGFNTSHDVTILECVEENGGGELKPYSKGLEALRAELERKAIAYSHNRFYHIKN